MAETLITDQRSDTASYKILRRLGKGGMAEVFLARQEGLAGFRRLTVIKKLLPQFSQVPEVAEMLLDEARIAAQLTHPNIVQIYELGKDEQSYFIAMEYVDGCDLATLARIERHRQSRVPLRLTLRVVSEASMGLDFAHRQTGLDGRPLNIVHRDVSPHNLMCSREGAVKVTDFGIAKAVGKALVTQVGVVKGKVQYMSPEQYVGGDVDHRSDIFSLGVVLYQLTTGKLPRVAKDGNLAMRRVIEGQIPRPSEIRPDYHDELEGIVMRALAHNPEERYPDAASFREDLLDFARENDLLAFPKELGDYVDAQVPPTPLVVREQSMAHVSTPQHEAAPPSFPPPGPEQVQVLDSSELPSVMVDGEESDTEAPAGTEVASPHGAKRRGSRSIVTDSHSDPLGVTEIPISSSSEPAVLPDEKFTPVIDRRGPSRPVVSMDELEEFEPTIPRDLDPSRERSNRSRKRVDREPREIVPRERKLRRPPGPMEGPDEVPSSLQPTPTGGPTALATAPPPPQTRAGLGAAAWLISAVALLSLGCVAVLLYLFVIDRPPKPTVKHKAQPVGADVGAGVINVLANPSNASVSIDGARRCPSTPCQVAGLPLSKELVLTVRSKGYVLWMQRVILTTSEPKLLLRADLTPLSKASRPLDKSKKSTSPSTASKGTKTKTRTKTKGTQGKGKRRPAGKKSTGPVTKGGLVTTDIEPNRCLLAIDVRPWAEVWVNGKKVGHTPMQVSMEPGKYKVELKNPELKFNKTYKIRARKGKKVKISLAIQPPGQPPPGQPPARRPPPRRPPTKR